MIVHYNNSAGLDLYVQFDNDTKLKLPLVPDVTDTKMYILLDASIVDAGLSAGTYNPCVKQGDYENPDVDDFIISSFSFKWDGASEASQDVLSGGGTLNARIGTVSLSELDYLEIVQGEQKVITFIVEAHGRFVTDSFGSIVVKIADPEGTVITKTEDDDSVIRVCEALDVQVLRCVLSEQDTAALTAGLCKIEIAFDSQKARLTHSIKILDAITSGES